MHVELSPLELLLLEDELDDELLVVVVEDVVLLLLLELNAPTVVTVWMYPASIAATCSSVSAVSVLLFVEFTNETSVFSETETVSHALLDSLNLRRIPLPSQRPPMQTLLTHIL